MKRSLCAAIALAALSCFSIVSSVARAAPADVVFTDLDGGKVRSINTDTLKITEITKGIATPYGVACLPNGDFLVASFAGEIIRVTPSGEKSVFAKTGGNPVGVYVDGADVYYSDYAKGDKDKGSFKKISPDGKITMVASGLTGPADITKRANGDFIVSNYSGGPTAFLGAPTAVYAINTDTGAVSIAQTTSGLVCPFAVLTSGETLYLGAAGSSRVTKKDGSAPQKVWASGALLNGIMDLVEVGGEMMGVNINSGNFLRITQKLGASGPYTEVSVLLKVGGMPAGAVVKPDPAQPLQ